MKALVIFLPLYWMGSIFQAVPYQLRSYCFHFNLFCFVEVYSLCCYYILLCFGCNDFANPLNCSDLSDPIIVGCFSTNDLSLNVSVFRSGSSKVVEKSAFQD